MKSYVIPTLFALDKRQFEDKLKILEFADKIHLDFMDGKFVNGKSETLDEMNSIKKLKDKFFEIHLMALDPAQYIKKIKELGIKKVLIQEEPFKNTQDIEKNIRKFKDEGLELFIVLNPTTSIERIKPLFELIDGIMVMSVWPGKEGQSFIEESYQKINEIREFAGEGFPIQVDGGIKDMNAKQLIDAGATILSVGSHISSAKTPKKNYEKLNKIITS